MCYKLLYWKQENLMYIYLFMYDIVCINYEIIYSVQDRIVCMIRIINFASI